MRSAWLWSAIRGPTLAIALVATAWPSVHVDAQDPPPPPKSRGAILVYATDTAINPIAAEIVLPAWSFATRLSEEGAILFVDVPDGLYLVQARHLGYRPEWRFVRVAGDTGRVEFILPPLDTRRGLVGSAIVESRLRDFLRRSAAMPNGSFITRAEIERRRPRSLVGLLGRLPNVTIDRVANGPALVRSRHTLGPHCAGGMLLFVDALLPAPSEPVLGGRRARTTDDARFPRSFRSDRRTPGIPVGWAELAQRAAAATSLGGASTDPMPSGGPRPGGRPMSALERIPVSTVTGVEVYPTLPSVPVEFRVAGSECGVVLVWTGK